MSPETMEAVVIETVSYTMEVPKESKELIDAECGIIEHFIGGGSLEGAAAFLPAVMKAVEGIKKIPAELKSRYNDEAAGYLVHKQWQSLKGGPDK